MQLQPCPPVNGGAWGRANTVIQKCATWQCNRHVYHSKSPKGREMYVHPGGYDPNLSGAVVGGSGELPNWIYAAGQILFWTTIGRGTSPCCAYQQSGHT